MHKEKKIRSCRSYTQAFVGSNAGKYKPDEKGNDDGVRKLKTTGSKDYWIIWPIFEIYQSRHISINPKMGNGLKTYLSLKISFNFRALNSFLTASPPGQWDHRHPLFYKNFTVGALDSADFIGVIGE